MNSMTGFGRAQATGAGVSVTVELKSVNNRFRDVHVRSPRDYSAIEPRIVAKIKNEFSRGRIDAHVRRVAQAGETEVVVNETLAKETLAALRGLANSIEGVDEVVSLEFLSKLPGVLTTAERTADSAAEWSVLEVAVDGAINHLAEMRAEEGAALKRDLMSNLTAIRDMTAEVASCADGVVVRLENRLTERVSRLLGEAVDPTRLAQEAAIQADKADIAEELSRLYSHCDQFEKSMTAKGPVGRRLDFLTQEMNREINTIGSKVVEAEASALVVDMKTALERIREQVANVE
jgi:uncharacterized protein (TIGR00255 family)